MFSGNVKLVCLQLLSSILSTKLYFQGLMLNEKKLTILSYVESRMSFIAPNLSAIVGPTVATKLMGTLI